MKHLVLLVILIPVTQIVGACVTTYVYTQWVQPSWWSVPVFLLIGLSWMLTVRETFDNIKVLLDRYYRMGDCE
jgi:hypothetical protein